ncbi:MAG: hypothetical protein ACREV5_04005 [Steroidobacter sp.]
MIVISASAIGCYFEQVGASRSGGGLTEAAQAGALDEQEIARPGIRAPKENAV